MAQWTLRQVTYSLTIFATTTLLSACGGGSGDDGTQISESSPSISESGLSSSRYAQESMIWESNQAPSQTAPPTENRLFAHSSSSSSRSTSPSSSSGPSGQDSDDYTLTFHDSFDGDIDRDVWNIDGDPSGGNTSKSTSNYGANDGSLKIWPERGRDGKFFKRTLDTKGRFEQKYGYFEIEAKLPKGKGAWPGFWLLNMSGKARPEIDIMEAYPGGVEPWSARGDDGVPSAQMYGITVWKDEKDQAGFAKIPTPDLAEGFHRYGAKWEPNKITFYFDGREVYSSKVTLDDPMFMIVNLWYGSASGKPGDSTPTGESNAYEIKYVKAWQFK